MSKQQNIELTASATEFLPIDWRIATAVGCGPGLRGYAISAKTILQCVKRARATYPDQVSIECLHLIEAHTDRVNQFAQGNPLLSTIDHLIVKERVYGQFSKPAKSNISTTALSRVNGSIGLIVLSTVAQSSTIPATVAVAWSRLQRSGSHREGRHPDWERLANDFPTSKDALTQWLSKATEPDMLVFLKTLEVALATPLLIPLVVHTRASELEGEKSQEAPDSSHITLDDSKEDAREVPAPPESFVGWLIQRANQSGFLSHQGLPGRWEKQTPSELIFVCKKIDAALAGTIQEQQFAVFSILSLSSGLPANLLVNVKLKPSTDLWVDFNIGCIHWCLLRFLDLDKAKSISLDGVSPSQIMDIWLPRRVQVASCALSHNHPDASNVIEFLTGRGDRIAMLSFLDEYRAWLTSLGSSSLHPIYDARFSRSLGQIYRTQFNDVFAAFCALDFEECSMGMLHYVQLPRQFVHSATTSVFETLGLGPAVTPPELSGVVGSTAAMDFSAFIGGLKSIWTRRENATLEMQSSNTTEQVVDRFTEIAHLDQLLELSLSAARDKHLERLTWGHLHAHPKLIVRADKDIDQYTKFRLIPAHLALKNVLNAHAEAKSLFCEKLERQGVKPRSPRGRRFDDNSPHLSFFATADVLTKDGTSFIVRRATDRKKLQALSEKYLNGFLNVGRHTIVSALVQTPIDPWLLKALTGHYRGQCEPFSDGQSMPPATAMRDLCNALDTLFLPLAPASGKYAADFTLPIKCFQGRLPNSTTEALRSEQSRARVLSAPFDGYTLASLRVIDQLAKFLRAGQGPEHAGANLLLNLLIGNWIALSDVKIIWANQDSFIQASSGCAHVTWTRPSGCAQIRVVLTAASLVSLGSFRKRGIDRTWEGANVEARDWLAQRMPAICWPNPGHQAVDRLSALMSRWLRFHLPPYLLATASPKMTSATASPPSFLRLIDSANESISRPDTLQYPKPIPRGKSNLRFLKSKLQQVIDLVHDYGNPQKHTGEDWQLMKSLSEAVSKIDCSLDLAAAAIAEWVQSEAALWVGSKGGRIQVSSLSTYVYLLAPAFIELTPIHNLKEWTGEWFEFTAKLAGPHTTEDSDKSDEKRADRITAAKRFTSQLSALGYPIPSDLFAEHALNTGDGMRKSAAAVLILHHDRAVVRRLMVEHFGDWPLDARLAGLYVDLRFNLSLRSIEAAVLPLSAIDQFESVAITSDGFSHLKSENSRRLQHLSEEFTVEFTRIAASVRAARPDASWLFLMDDRSDWRLIVTLEKAFSAALKQVTNDPDATPHSSRSVMPLAALFPGWEALSTNMLNGTASHTDYELFLRALEEKGFTNITSVLLAIGHGHPLTFLKYYFAIWDLLISVFLRKHEMSFDDSAELIRHHRVQHKAAFTKARQRQGAAFNGPQWLISKELKSLGLPLFQCSLVPLQAAADKMARQKDRIVPIKDQVRYLAARFAKLEALAAAHEFNIDTQTLEGLEVRFMDAETDALLVRHQSKVSVRGKEAEVRFLKSAAGALLTRKLLHAGKVDLENFGDALSPKRTYKALAPPASVIQKSLESHLDCLPPSLSILIQFAPGKYGPDELARLGSFSPRVRIGAADPDLAARPRISVIETDAPGNLVLRARRTSSTRCLIASILLLANS